MDKNRDYTKYVELLVMIALFILLMRFAISYGLSNMPKLETTGDKIIFFVGIFVMGHIVFMVHELGHLLTGLFQGFRFELFVVGLLGVRREAGKVKWYLNKNMAYYGGVASTLPVDDADDNLKKFGRMIIAGPIVSLLFAIFCIVIYQYIPYPYGQVVFVGGILSIGTFLATTVPSRTGMFFTDRKRYQRLMTPGKTQDVELAMLKVMGAFNRDMSYANIKKKDIQTLTTDDIPFMKYYGWFNMVCWQIEHQGKVEEEVKSSYIAVSKTMNKNMVEFFDKEVKKYADTFKVENVL